MQVQFGGFQRTYKSNFYLDLNLGLGYARYDVDLKSGFYDSFGSVVGYETVNFKGGSIKALGMFRLGFYIGKK